MWLIRQANYVIIKHENFTMMSMADRFKQSLRATYKQIRKKLSPAYQLRASRQVCAQIQTLDQYRYAKRIALYQAVAGEINLSPLWHSAPLQGKYCYFPALNDDHTLSFLPATPSTPLRKNQYGIEEPDVPREDALPPDQIDLMFIPLVAFDLRGTRLGMGAGYYDRSLADSRSKLLVGVAYEFQRLSYIEAQVWDIFLNVIITEQATYWRV